MSRLNAGRQLGVALDVPAEDVADADVHQVEVLREHLGLRALAAALHAHDDVLVHGRHSRRVPSGKVAAGRCRVNPGGCGRASWRRPCFRRRRDRGRGRRVAGPGARRGIAVGNWPCARRGVNPFLHHHEAASFLGAHDQGAGGARQLTLQAEQQHFGRALRQPADADADEAVRRLELPGDLHARLRPCRPAPASPAATSASSPAPRPGRPRAGRARPAPRSRSSSAPGARGGVERLGEQPPPVLQPPPVQVGGDAPAAAAQAARTAPARRRRRHARAGSGQPMLS